MEKLDKVIRCLDVCYKDECWDCDYCGHGCSEVLGRDALEVIEALRAERDDLRKDIAALTAERDFAADLAQAYGDFVEATLEHNCETCGNSDYVHEYETYVCRCGDDCHWIPKGDV